MGFKSNREFLRNITIGAVGTRQVSRLLARGGCRVIELERYSQNNKIWATKVKRLRLPDLLCLQCGRRIESRAKSDLEIRMSHSKNNPERAWDKGLRDQDLVAFIHCNVTDDIQWQASDELALFLVGDLRASAHLAKESRMKSAAEGSEVFLTWPACVPTAPGTVAEVGGGAIKVRFESGRTFTYRLARQGSVLVPHVQPGDTFGAGTRIIASVLPHIIPTQCPVTTPYDFVADLMSGERETVYAAVKALGFLPALRTDSLHQLAAVLESHGDHLVRLEAAASLAKLDDAKGWRFIHNAALSGPDSETRMEAILILSEIPSRKTLDILSEVAVNRTAPTEVRAAATWGMCSTQQPIVSSPLLDLLADDDELTALHAIVSASRMIDDSAMPQILAALGTNPRVSAGIIQSLQLCAMNPVPYVIKAIPSATGAARHWLLYLLARLGRARSKAVLTALPELHDELEFFWTYHGENWTNRTDVADQVEFLRQQLLE